MGERAGWSAYVRGWTRAAVQRIYGRTFPAAVRGWDRARAFEIEAGVRPADPLAA